MASNLLRLTRPRHFPDPHQIVLREQENIAGRNLFHRSSAATFCIDPDRMDVSVRTSTPSMQRRSITFVPPLTLELPHGAHGVVFSEAGPARTTNKNQPLSDSASLVKAKRLARNILLASASNFTAGKRPQTVCVCVRPRGVALEI